MLISHTTYPPDPCRSFNEWSEYIHSRCRATDLLLPAMWRTIVSTISGHIQQELPGTYSRYFDFVQGELMINLFVAVDMTGLTIYEFHAYNPSLNMTYDLDDLSDKLTEEIRTDADMDSWRGQDREDYYDDVTFN